MNNAFIPQKRKTHPVRPAPESTVWVHAERTTMV